MWADQIDRRQALSVVTGALVGISGGLAGFSARAQAIRRVIDVHCHIFNGKDIPAQQFVKQVVFENYGQEVELGPGPIGDFQQRARNGAAEIVIAMIKATAPSAARERACIEAGRCSALWSIFGGESGPGAPAGLSEEELIVADYARLKAGQPREKFFVGEEWTAKLGELDALMEVLKSNVQRGPGPQGEAVDVNDEAARRQMASQLADPSFEFGPMIQWGRLLSSFRRDVAARYLEGYDRAPNSIVLFAPALVNFTSWLQGESPEKLDDQVNLMDLISRRQTRGLMHGYVAYDPLHQIRSIADGANPTALSIVKTAVEQHGFLGVKLYPPMGFQPLGNTGLHRFPATVVDDPATFTSRLDAALIELYDWCAHNDVPIMAHAMNSQAANKDYGARADPKHWHEPLRRYPNLRLNLAHFGNFRPVGSEDVTSSWEWTIGNIVAEGNTPNLYADLSYFSLLLGHDNPSQARLTAAKDMLVRWIREFDPQCTRILFGTDWSMIAQQSRSDDYVTGMEAFLRSANLSDEQLDNIFFKNAIRFFGLGRGEPGRRRLEAHYRANSLDIRLLEKLD